MKEKNMRFVSALADRKGIGRIGAIIIFILTITVLFIYTSNLNSEKNSNSMGYEDKLFDTSKVHTLNIIMDDWDDFTANCQSENYYACSVEIDDEMYENIAIRGKGNTSLMQVSSSENDRYSFKIEFDHYNSSNTYHGLDKLCLNNIIQDTTYMKDYLTYQMMSDMGVAAPLCSYVYITVNGEDWGLYLAVEGVEESFLERNYGSDYGKLYKPDTAEMGGSRMSNMERPDGEMPGMERPSGEMSGMERPAGEMPNMERPDGEMPDMERPAGEMPGMERPDGGMPGMGMPNGERPGEKMQGHGMNNTSDDILLKYVDDNVESYSNIFDSAKIDISLSDKRRLIQALKNLSEGKELDDTVDIEAVIRYFVVHNFVLNFDSYTGSIIHNYYLYEKHGQLQMIPWDYNLAFGGFQSMEDATSLVNYPIDSPVSGGNTEDRPMIAWIFENEEYTEMYHQIFAEFISEYFESDSFTTMFDQVIEMIAPYVEKDPTKFCTCEEFEKGTETLREFCILRAKSVKGQLDGSIGATTDTQDGSTFIDAGALQIRDMGTMENGKDLKGYSVK